MFINNLIPHVAELDLTSAANHLWQATLFAALAFFMTLLLSRARAQTRYIVWLIAALKFALPSALIALFIKQIGRYTAWTQDALPAQVGKVYVASETAQTLLEPFGVATVQDTSQYGVLKVLLMFIWIVGFAALIARWMWRRRNFYRVIASEPAMRDGRAWEMLLRLKRRMDVRGYVELKISEAFTAPGVWGMWHSVIAMPKGLADLLDDAELEALLMHELAHIRRRDNLVSTLQMLVCCLFWFHPLVWLIDRHLLAERERACDETVIEFGGAKHVYLSGILKVLRFCFHSRVAGASGAGGSNVQRRIAYIMDENAKINSTLWHRLIVGGIVVAAVVVSLTTGLLSRDDSVKAQDRNAGAQGGSYGRASRRRPATPAETRAADIGAMEPSGFNEPAFELDEPLELVSDPQTRAAIDEVMRAPETAVRFENDGGSALNIISATMKVVTADQFRRMFRHAPDADAKEYVTLPTVMLVNTSPRKITTLALRFESQADGSATLEKIIPIEPGASYTLQGRWGGLNAALAGNGSDVSVKIAAVQWADGTRWGDPAIVPPPPPPPAPDEPPPPSEPPSPPRRSSVTIK
jgi:beta-lactamase regulating signal transducer with metallopeptidase domain